MRHMHTRRRRFLFGLATAVALFALAPRPALAEDDKAAAKAHYEQGTKLYNLGEFADAEKEYRAAYMATPDPVLLFNIAQCARLQGHFDDALKLYRSYLRARPEAANRADVEGFIYDAEQQKESRLANKQPTGTAPIDVGEHENAASATPQNTPRVATDANTLQAVPVVAVTPKPEHEPETVSKKKTWLWITLGAVAVVGVGVGVGLGVGLTRGNGSPHTSFGTLAELP